MVKIIAYLCVLVGVCAVAEKCTYEEPGGSLYPISVDKKKLPDVIKYACEEGLAFNEKHPGVNISWADWNDLVIKLDDFQYRNNLLAAFQDTLDRKTDSYELSSMSLAIFQTTAEGMLPLDFSHGFAPFLNDFSLERLPLNALGQPVGLPVKLTQLVLLYDVDAFERAGIPISKDPSLFPQSLDEFEIVMEKIQTAGRSALGHDNYWALALNFEDDSNSFLPRLISWLSCEDGGRLVINGKLDLNHPTYIKLVKRMKRWVGWFLRPTLSTGTNRYDVFREEVAVVDAWIVESKKVDEQNANNGRVRFKVGPFPGKTCKSTAGGLFLGLAKHTRHPEIGMDLLRAASYGVVDYFINKRFPPFSSRHIASSEDFNHLCPNYTGKKTSVIPSMCIAYKEYQPFMDSLINRPTECGMLYSSCAGIVFSYFMQAMESRMTVEEMVVAAQHDMNTLLGYVEGHGVKPSKSRWTTARTILVIVSALVGIFLLGFIFYVKREMHFMRENRGVPISVMVGLVVGTCLAVVIAIVIVIQNDSVRAISKEMASIARSATLDNYHGVLSLILSSDDTYEGELLISTASAALASRLTNDVLMENSLFVLVDRDKLRVRVASDPVRQLPRIPITDPTFRTINKGVSSWVSQGLLELSPTWFNPRERLGDSQLTYEITVDGEVILMNYQSIIMRYPRVDLILLYFVSEETILGEANRALDKALDISITMSLVAVVIAIGSAVVISKPLIKLAADMEYVRNMEMEKRSADRRSIIREVASLYRGFDFMCKSLEEFRSYLPQSLLVKEEDDAASIRHMSVGGDASDLSSSTATSISRMSKSGPSPLLRCQLYNASSGVVLRIVVPQNLLLSDADRTGCLISFLEENSKTTRGVLHPFTVHNAGDITLSWNILQTAGDACSKAASVALALSQTLPKVFFQEAAGIQIAISRGSLTYGNMGTNTFRGFCISGEILSPFPVLLKMSEDFGTALSLVVIAITGDLRNRLRASFTCNMMDYSMVATSVTSIWRLTSKNSEEKEEWMYELAKEEEGDQVSLILDKLRLSHNLHSTVKQLQGLPPDPWTAFIVARLKKSISIWQNSDIQDLPYYTILRTHLDLCVPEARSTKGEDLEVSDT